MRGSIKSLGADYTKERIRERIETVSPKFERLYPIITYLKIPADKIFYPTSIQQSPELQMLHTMLNDCTDQEALALMPIIRDLLDLLRKQDSLH